MTRILPESREALEALLAHLGVDPAGNDVFPFGRLTGVHYARFVRLEEARDLRGLVLPPQLVLMIDVDGSVERCLNELVDMMNADVASPESNCW